jgi:hypothetical protein
MALPMIASCFVICHAARLMEKLLNTVLAKYRKGNAGGRRCSRAMRLTQVSVRQDKPGLNLFA